MKTNYYKLYYGNFFDCSLNEKQKLEHLLRLKKQPLMTKKDAKIYLDNSFFNKHQIKKDFYYYLLSPTKSDLYVDIAKKLDTKRTFKRGKTKSDVPIILLKKWQAYEREKSRNSQNDRVISYDKGYYLHLDSILKEYDVFFRQNASKYTSQLIDVLSCNSKKNQRAIAAYLLGWSKETDKVQKALEQTFTNDPEHEIHNAAGRSLFPILLKKKKIKIDSYIDLLHHSHTLCRNKACGTLAFAPLTKKQKNHVIQRAFNVLKEMYNSPHPYNKGPAVLLAQRWNIQKILKNDSPKD